MTFIGLPISREIIDVFRLSAGGTILACREALQNRWAVHLSGGFHHAFADKAEGFCYLNDLAVAAKVIQKDRLLKQVAIIDCDLHQGNGTAHIFQNDSKVYTFSIHQENNYPLKQKSNIDIGLEDGVQDDLYLTLLEEALKTIFHEFEPQFIIYVGGVDPYEQDQLGGLKITKDGMQTRDSMVFQYCQNSQVPVAVVLAGGYARDVKDTVEMHLNTYFALSSI